MAADLAGLPRTGLHAQLCGDAHLSNFGGYAAPDRQIVFDVNDFDETLPGPFEWDVKRLVASFAVAGRDRGFDQARRQPINLAVGRSYREAIAGFGGMRTLDVWYSRLDVEESFARWSTEVSPKAVTRFERTVAKARTKDNLAAFAKLTHLVDGEPRIVSDPPLIVPMSELITSDQALEAGGRCSATAATCSSASGSSTPPARWWGSEASARGPSSCSSSGATTTTRSSCR
jgi:hypothetical protein